MNFIQEIVDQEAQEILEGTGYPWQLLILWLEIWFSGEGAQGEIFSSERVQNFRKAMNSKNFGVAEDLICTHNKREFSAMSRVLLEQNPEDAIFFLEKLPIHLQAFLKLLKEVILQRREKAPARLEQFHQESREWIMDLL